MMITASAMARHISAHAWGYRGYQGEYSQQDRFLQLRCVIEALAWRRFRVGRSTCDKLRTRDNFTGKLAATIIGRISRYLAGQRSRISNMATQTRGFGWINAVLAALVSLALVIAPLAGVHDVPCHDHAAHGKVGAEHAASAEDAHPSLGGKVTSSPAKACCSQLCGFHVALANQRIEAPAVMSAVLRAAWADQAGSGLAPSPTLGPPRLPA